MNELISPYPMQTIEIPLSKIKITLLILGSIAFVAMGIWLWSIADEQTRRDPMIVKTISAVCIAFFGTCGVVGLMMMFNKKPGLVIDDRGIFIFSAFGDGTYLPWQNITGLGELSIRRNKSILLYINNVDEVIAAKKPWAQKMARISVNQYGTPISITSSILTMSHKELMNVLEKALTNADAKK